MTQVIRATLYFLSAFVPLVFTTFNSELFEFPKFIILLSGTLVISAAWIIDLYHSKSKLEFKLSHQTLISLSILAILATQLLSTLTSIHPYTSFWGYYSRFHQGLLTTICYTIIYFSALKYVDNKSTLKLIKISVFTSILVSIYAVLERFGIDKNLWVQDVQHRPFSTLGQPNWLAAYLIPHYFLTLYLGQTKKLNSHLSSLISLLIFAALLLTKSRSGILAFALSYVTYFALLTRQFSFTKLKTQIISTSLLIITTLAIVGSSFTPSLLSLIGKSKTSEVAPVPQGTQLDNGGTESGDIRKIVWTGALELIKKYPLLGTGPETFAYTYYWVRPLAHNNTSEWDFLYNKAHNEYLNIAATTGVIGLLSYLFFHYAVFARSLTLIPRSKSVKQDEDDSLRYILPVLGGSLVGFTLTNFFGFSVIPVYMSMVLLSALPVTITNTQKSPSLISPSSSIIYFILPLILVYPIRLFLADYNYAQGKRLLDSGNPATALPLLQNAVAIRPSLDLFRSTLGEAYASLGQNNLALEQVDLLRTLNPHHLNFYKSRAKVYLTLAANEPRFYANAAAEIEKAVSLAPTDPKLAYNLGLIYTRMDQNDKSANELRRSIELKPNYEPPYYALTLLYEQTNQKSKLPDLMNLVTQNLATYSAALKEKVDNYTFK